MTDFEKLKADFVKCHVSDYLAIKPYLEFLDAAYYLGHKEGKTNIRKRKPVIRSDGKEYGSLTEAGEKNLITKSAVGKAIKFNYKAVGYYWEYKTI